MTNKSKNSEPPSNGGPDIVSSEFTNALLRNILKTVVVDNIVLVIDSLSPSLAPHSKAKEKPSHLCKRLQFLRGILLPASTGPWQPIENYLNRFLGRGCIDTQSLVPLLQDVGGFSQDEAECAAPILKKRLAAAVTRFSPGPPSSNLD